VAAWWRIHPLVSSGMIRLFLLFLLRIKVKAHP
jgi:hypothetical protein